MYSISDMSQWKAFFSCAVNFLADTTRGGLLHSVHSIVMPVFVACCFTTLNGTLLPWSLEVFKDGTAASVVCVPNTLLNLLKCVGSSGVRSGRWLRRWKSWSFSLGGLQILHSQRPHFFMETKYVHFLAQWLRYWANFGCCSKSALVSFAFKFSFNSAVANKLLISSWAEGV